MKTTKKLTKKYFCSIYEDMTKLRRKDPRQPFGKEEVLKELNKRTAQIEHERELRLSAIKIELKNKFIDLCGSNPSIISPDNKPFAVFYPKTKDEYLNILKALQPTEENAKLTFAGKSPIETASQYLIDYGGEHSSPNYMEAKIIFNYPICPVWIKISGELLKGKFHVSTLRGEHKGFGNYETKYTLHADKATTVQQYYGENKTMYAANESEAKELKDIIFS